MKRTLIGLIAAAMLYGCGDKGFNTSHMSIEKVQRYSSGKVLNLNRLSVYWSRNDNCGELGSKYDYTTGDLIYDNVRKALEGQDLVIFNQGFQDGYGNLVLPDINSKGSAKPYWENKRPYVIESTMPESVLVDIGQKIYTCVCNDVE